MCAGNGPAFVHFIPWEGWGVRAQIFGPRGCELVQGYLLGVPLPYEDSITACQKRLQQLRKAGLK